MLHSFAPAVIVLAFMGFVISWVFAVYYMIRVAMSRSPSAPFRWTVAMNPLNTLFFSGDLTGAGLTYRQRFLLALVGGVASVLVLAVTTAVMRT